MESIPIRSNVILSLSNFSDEIYKLISPIRPKWNSSNTRLVKFTDGISNVIVGLFDNQIEDYQSTGLVIKMFGANTELFIDRQSELDAMIKFSKHGVISQHVLILFENGFVYEFAPGEVCSREDVTKENVSKLISTKLAQLHSIPVNKIDKPYILIILRKYIQLLNENEQQAKEIESLVSDVDMIEKEILPKLVPNAKLGRDLVVCHNDLLVKNIVYDVQKEEVSFIDFEYANVNYYLYDIANHFVEYAGVDDADFSLYPTIDEQKRWLNNYFQTRQMNPPVTVNDDLCHLIEQFSALTHLMWGLWALLQSRLSQIDFDYRSYSKLRLDNYYRLKPILFQVIQN